ncbi:MAG: amidohydrolase [Gemmatimonadota bacterium]|nr:MAG: amidohydrolase [Gemmatimonadota bacterium]
MEVRFWPSSTVAVVVLSLCWPGTGVTQSDPDLARALDERAKRIEGQVIEWRRDIHQHPELGNHEFRTAQLVADHLRSMGMEVRTEVAHTGVVAVLRGGKPGPVVALRADMDALPVTEQVDLPFASKVTTIYNGREVGVMHACGHDNHTAILMGAAQVLAEVSDSLPGTVKFIFQPAEEGAPEGEDGGADLMIREGALEDPSPEVVFGLHVFPGEVGTIGYTPGGALASADGLRIVVRGRQTHGAMPWGGIDPVVVAAQIVLGLQTVASRQLDVTKAASVITVASIHGGVRGNIIPDEVVMEGTIRSLDHDMQSEIHQRVRRTAQLIAESAGATADVSIRLGVPVTVNDPDLTELMVPTLERVAGEGRAFLKPPTTGAEDFSYFAQQVPGLYLSLGVTPRGANMDTVAVNHSPKFYADEEALLVGVRALVHMTVDYMLARR